MKRAAPEEALDDGGPLYAKPRARLTDPETSHAAAAELKRESVTRLRSVVLSLLRKCEMDDRSLVVLALQLEPKYSQSGIRTRRAELVELGLVEDSGKRVRMPSGRMAIVWRAPR